LSAELLVSRDGETKCYNSLLVLEFILSILDSERGLYQACRLQPRTLAEPRAFFRRRGPADAADSGRLRSQPEVSEARSAWRRVTLVEGEHAVTNSHVDLIAVDEALQQLAKLDARKARVVELRFFGGLSLEETAEALQVSTDSVGRDWRAAKAWLMRELKR
jgi:RNA polymerase sigma factor (sigma-70 family)